MMEENCKINEDFVHLARIALSERTQDVHTFLYRIAKRKSTDENLSSKLVSLLRKYPTRSSPLRRTAEITQPVDADTRFQLLRVEEEPILPGDIIYPDSVERSLNRLVDERKSLPVLLKAGLEPTRTVLFTGPPGVGKTLAARWIANRMKRPLFILDLSAVMSSYLGRTGSNLRHVLDYAKTLNCVLLLDELDAIAKRRDDAGEIGELKRLVTVLLQQLDDWPSSGILLAATNHSKLLDPAVWRRFEEQVDFPLPGKATTKTFVTALLRQFTPDVEIWSEVLSISLSNQSFSDIENKMNTVRRFAALNGNDAREHLLSLLDINNKSKQDRIDLAVQLVASGLVSQRRAHEMTGIARDTIRVRLHGQPESNTE